MRTSWISTQPGFFTNLAIRSEVLSKISSAINRPLPLTVCQRSRLTTGNSAILNQLEVGSIMVRTEQLMKLGNYSTTTQTSLTKLESSYATSKGCKAPLQLGPRRGLSPSRFLYHPGIIQVTDVTLSMCFRLLVSCQHSYLLTNCPSPARPDCTLLLHIGLSSADA